MRKLYIGLPLLVSAICFSNTNDAAAMQCFRCFGKKAMTPQLQAQKRVAERTPLLDKGEAEKQQVSNTVSALKKIRKVELPVIPNVQQVETQQCQQADKMPDETQGFLSKEAEVQTSPTLQKNPMTFSQVNDLIESKVSKIIKESEVQKQYNTLNRTKSMKPIESSFLDDLSFDGLSVENVDIANQFSIKRGKSTSFIGQKSVEVEEQVLQMQQDIKKLYQQVDAQKFEQTTINQQTTQKFGKMQEKLQELAEEVEERFEEMEEQIDECAKKETLKKVANTLLNLNTALAKRMDEQSSQRKQ